MATALVNLARFYMKTAKYDDARPLLTRALAIQENGLGPEHPDVAVTLSSRAELAAHTGATIEAFAMAARAEALSREHLRLTVRTLPERQALAYASSLPSGLDLMLNLASTRSGDSQMSVAAWNAVIRARGMVLDEVAARHRSGSAGEDKEIVGLAEALASARQRLAALAVRGIQKRSPRALPPPSGTGSSRKGQRRARASSEERAVPRRPVEEPCRPSRTGRSIANWRRCGLRQVSTSEP